MSGGAIAGIIVGSLAAVVIIGALVWYFFKGGSKEGGSKAADTAAQMGSNSLPMVALRVSDDDDL